MYKINYSHLADLLSQSIHLARAAMMAAKTGDHKLASELEIKMVSSFNEFSGALLTEIDRLRKPPKKVVAK